MSGCKSELIAIYKLEFYKKQKNWKLSTDKAKLEKLRSPVTLQLNKTYNVEGPAFVKAEESLNKAFLESDCGSDIEQEFRSDLSSEHLQSSKEFLQPWSSEQLLWMPDLEQRPLWPSREASPDSTAEFMLGAHSAPHSSELQLSCTAETEEGGLSRGALQERLQLHAARLLRGADARHQLNRTPSSDDESCEECPTRDVGPLQPLCTFLQPLSALLNPPFHTPSPHRPKLHKTLCENAFVSDSFVAGSFMYDEGLGGCSPLCAGRGRGRGRVQKEHVIGIGGGRPYRL